MKSESDNVDYLEESVQEPFEDSDSEETDAFFKIIENEPYRSKTRNTRSEVVTARLHNFENSRRPDLLMTKIIDQLMRRVTEEERTAPIALGIKHLNIYI